VEESLRNGCPPHGWKVTRYRNEIKTGDVAFLWLTGNPQGNITTYKIRSDPYYIPPNLSDPYWSGIYKVVIHLLEQFLHLDAEFLKKVSGKCINKRDR